MIGPRRQTRALERRPPRAVVQMRLGFTLLETVVALVVVALVVVSALTTVGAQLRVAAHTDRVARAAGLADQRLVLMDLLSGVELRALPDTIRQGRFPPPDNAFTWHVTSTPVVNELDLDDVRIEVQWNDGAYILRSRVYRPLVAPAPR